jgi:DNA-binding HxlR family transcriptional regulator
VPTKRSYRQHCGVARALDVVGERWTLLVERDLLKGPRRYGDLLAGLPGITTNLLAARLKDMEAHGLIAKRRLPPPAASVVYELTDEGRSLEPVVMALGAWGGRFMARLRKGDKRDLRWGFLSLKRRFRGASRAAVIEVRAGERVFQFRLAPGALDVREGTPWGEAEATLTADEDVFRDLFFGGAPPERMRRLVDVTGADDAFELLVGAFGPSPFTLRPPR